MFWLTKALLTGVVIAAIMTVTGYAIGWAPLQYAGWSTFATVLAFCAITLMTRPIEHLILKIRIMNRRQTRETGYYAGMVGFAMILLAAGENDGASGLTTMLMTTSGLLAISAAWLINHWPTHKPVRNWSEYETHSK